MLEDLFSTRGVTVLDWRELERIATNPLQSAVLAVLANALTVRTAAIALDQYQGALARAIETIRKAIQAGDTSGAERSLAEIDRYSGVGLHLATPWRVAIAGAPNVGKSSLVNALAGYQRSVVSPTPGTTRDVVTTLLALDGWPVEVSDTAGWREAETALEGEGITRAGEAIAAADLTLWVLDGAAPPTWPPANLGSFRYVTNKVDLPAGWPHDTVEAVRVSAHTGAGLAALCEAIANWLEPEDPPAGAAVAFTVKLAAGLKLARDLMKEGRSLEALAKLESLCRECD
jgi:tRNA modification GTPase